MRRTSLLLSLVTLACNGGEAKTSDDPGNALPAKVAATSEAGAAATKRPASASRPIVSLVGASVTVGFVYGTLMGGSSKNNSASIAEVLEVLWPESVVVAQHGDLWTFQNPGESGERQIAKAMADKPAAVVAIDFLFWFAHARGASKETRMARLERGLALLDRVKAPLIVGDLPNMRGADPKMLAPASVPSDEVLAALNKRIAAWVAERERATLFPLGEWMAAVRASGYVFVLKAGERSASRDSLLQTDRLHASRLGMVAVTERLQPLIAGQIRALGGKQRALEEIFRRLGVAIPSD